MQDWYNWSRSKRKHVSAWKKTPTKNWHKKNALVYFL